MKASACGGRFF